MTKSPSNRAALADAATLASAATAVRIRLEAPSDAHDIAVLGDRAWRVAYAGLVPDELFERLSVARRMHRCGNPQPSRACWVAERADRVLAYCSSGRARDEDPPPTRAEVYACYVHPDAWRQGLGTRLMRHVLKDLPRRGFDTVVLWCLTDNAQARRFYESLGFTLESERVPRTLDGFELDHARYRRAL